MLRVLFDHILQSNSLLNADGVLVSPSEYEGRPHILGSKGVPGPPIPVTEPEAHMLIAFALQYLRAGNRAGRTVLHEAAGRGRLECVKFLLEANANARGEGGVDLVPLETLDKEGNTALHLAVQHRDHEIVATIMEVMGFDVYMHITFIFIFIFYFYLFVGGPEELALSSSADVLAKK